MTLESIRQLVADDAHALTFQTFGQYRTALLKAIDQADLPTPAPTMVDERGIDINAIYDQIKEVLMEHRMSYTYEDEDSALPLVDMLCTPNAKDVSTGKEEITLICDAIYSEVLAPLATLPTLQSLGGDAGVSEETHTIEGTVTFLRSDPDTQVCVCCPKGGGHIFARHVKWDSYETNHPAHFGNSANVFVDSRITDYNSNEGRRVRLTVELLPAAPKAAEKSGRSE